VRLKKEWEIKHGWLEQMRIEDKRG